MRVVHVDTGREMRGGQWQVWLLHQGLIEAGIDSILLCPTDSPLFQKVRDGGLPLEALRRTDWPEADLYHAHDARAHTLAAVNFRRPLIVSRRVAFPLQRSLFSRWKYRQARRFLAISRHVQGVMEEGGVPAERIRVVYDGVPLPESMASGETIVAPATADSMKGSDLVREAARLSGCTVEFSDDLARDLPRAALLIYLSRSEGLGSAALLAAAYGAPVLASAIGGLAESVEDGRTGLLVSNDPRAVAESMRKLMDDPERRRTMGLAGRRMVEQRFSVERMVEETIRNYKEVLA